MTKEIIKFLTAGNVDDGKSTLIGRLLYDTDSLYQDQIDEVKKSTDASFKNGDLDFSLFLDGLSSERAQKITIDVAYRYFSYQNNKFIIADSPGHEQYTRNMAVAASNSDAVIILIDATKGVKTQTIRHSYIAHLFGIKKVIVAINKMDLVDYSYDVFDGIRKIYLDKTADLDFDNIYFVPIVALLGDNIVVKGNNIPWYHGKTIIDYLLIDDAKTNPQNLLRFQIQNVIKHDEGRYYQGLLSSGELKVGDEIITYPAKKLAKITKIIHLAREVESAEYGSSLAISLDREIDLDRGGLIANTDYQPYFSNHFTSHLIWFSDQAFDQNSNGEYLIKINHQYLRAKISNINYVVDINNLSHIEDNKAFQQNSIILNQISNIDLAISGEVAFDLFKDNKTTGSFLLIDKNSNETVACGVISAFSLKENKPKDKQQEFLLELSALVKKYFGNNTNIDFTI